MNQYPTPILRPAVNPVVDSSLRKSAPPFSVTVKVTELRHAMRIRGLSGSELARRANVSAATISHALNGRRLHPRTLRALVMALAKIDPVPGADHLVDSTTTSPGDEVGRDVSPENPA